MNKCIIIIILTVYQSIGILNAEVKELLSLPVVHGDVMSFFQAEMPTLMETFDWAYLDFAFRGNLTRLKIEKGSSSQEPWISASENHDALIYQGMAGGQFKLTKDGMLCLPIFAAVSFTESNSELSYYGFSPYKYEFPRAGYSKKTNESVLGVFAGSGIVINGGLFEGGIFAGYYYGFNKYNSTVYYYDEQLEQDTVEYSNPFPFKIVFMPSVNTNRLANIGQVFDKIAGFIGMGEVVEVFSENEQRADNRTQQELLIDALNYGLEIISSKFTLSSSELNMKVFYRRDQYDSASKTDTYGGVFFFSWFQLLTRIEGGYKHFYSVSKNFESRYFDTGYVDINIGFQFGEKFSLMATYSYDAVAKHRFGLGFDFFVETATVGYGNDEDRGINFMDAALRIGY
jgi:hypothetical protein